MKNKGIPCVVFINSMKDQKEIKRWAIKNQIDSRSLNPGFYRYYQYVYYTKNNRILADYTNRTNMGEFCGDNIDLFKKLCRGDVIR